MIRKSEDQEMAISKSSRWSAAGAFTLVALGVVGGFALARYDGEKHGGAEVTQVLSQKLENAPGQTLTALVVRYGPGGKSTSHHHAGSVFAYVLSGAIRSENSATGPARVYRAGESFFEPVGSVHRVSENASATEPASLLAVFVANDGAKLTTDEPAQGTGGK
jgi:quercetin dioxygenase-like cupin family protein